MNKPDWHWYYKLDDAGEPVPTDLDGWGQWVEQNEGPSVRVGDTTIGDVRISTVFFGLNYSFGGPVPVLWKTMVFGGPLDGAQRRYSSRADAVAGHAAMVAEVEAARWGD